MKWTDCRRRGSTLPCVSGVASTFDPRPKPGSVVTGASPAAGLGTRTGSPGGAAVSRETSQPPRRSTPWSARARPVSARRPEAHEGRRGSGRVKAGWGKPLEGLKNPRRGSAPIARCNSRRPEYGLPIRAETPGGALETGHALARGAGPAPRSGNGRHAAAWNGSSSGGRYGERRRRTPGGARGAERCPGDRKGNPLKGEPQERRRYETRPAGSRGERSVKRPRKPEDAAQPGQVSPVQVAPRHLMRCRGEEPQESASVPIRRLVRCETADSPARVILWSRAKLGRGSRIDSSSLRDPGPREDLEDRPREGRRSRRGRQPMGRYREPRARL